MHPNFVPNLRYSKVSRKNLNSLSLLSSGLREQLATPGYIPYCKDPLDISLSSSLLAEINIDNLEVISFHRHLLALFTIPCPSCDHFSAAYLSREFPTHAMLRDSIQAQCPSPWRNLHPLNNNGKKPHRHAMFPLLPLGASFKGRLRWQPSTLARNCMC